MFRMYGDIVELYRYKITYETIEPIITDGEPSEQAVTRTEYCISDERRDELIKSLGNKPYTVESIDQTGNEWLDGMSFDSYESAQQALEMGESAYKKILDPITEIQLALAEIYEAVMQSG